MGKDGHRRLKWFKKNHDSNIQGDCQEHVLSNATLFGRGEINTFFA